MTRQTIIEVYPRIYQILGVRRSAHVYLVRGMRKNMLIDCGLPTTVEHLGHCLAELGMTPADIDIVLLTHEHIDHAGGAPSFSKTSMIAAHRLAANKLALKDEFSLMNRFYEGQDEDFEVDLLLDEGSSINLGNYEFEVLHTPGHCSGAICVFEPNHRLLFSADTIMANGVVGGVVASGNTSDYIHSLKRLSGLKLSHLYPGHGKTSDTPDTDILTGMARMQTLLEETKMLFNTVKDSNHGFNQIVRSLRDLNIK